MSLVLRCAISTLLAVLVAPHAWSQAPAVDRVLPPYRKAGELLGRLVSVGSDALNNLMTLWAEQFIAAYPQATFEIEGKGTRTGPSALIAGVADFAPSARPWRDRELDAFREKYGYAPTGLRVALDQLAVFVHAENPLRERGLTLAEVDAILSSTRRSGHPADIVRWGDLGLEGEWKDQPIRLHGRNSASGTFGVFKELALAGGDFKPTLHEHPGSTAVVRAVASDRFGIGYSGAGYATEGVAAVPLAGSDGRPVPPGPERAATYPLSRYLWVFLNQPPGEGLPPLRREFIRLMFSRQGQTQVARDGYFPIDAAIAREELRKVGLELEEVAP